MPRHIHIPRVQSQAGCPYKPSRKQPWHIMGKGNRALSAYIRRIKKMKEDSNKSSIKTVLITASLLLAVAGALLGAVDMLMQSTIRKLQKGEYGNA